MYSGGVTNRYAQASTLKHMFDRHAEETISDEQVRRVIAPVLARIKTGEFNRPHEKTIEKPEDKLNRVFRLLPQAVASIAAAAVVISATIFWQNGSKNILVEIPGANPPLAGKIPAVNTLIGGLTLEGQGISGVELTLIETRNMQVVGTAVTDDDGDFSFRNIKDGTYMLVALPFAYSVSGEAIEVGIWTVANGKIEPVNGVNIKDLWKGAEMILCLDQ